MGNQREMPFLGELPPPKMVEVALIKLCKHRLDAIRLCVQLSRLTHSTVGDYLGIDKGHWTRIMQGRAHFPDSKANDLMRICGNFAPLQYEAWANGFDLQERKKDDRIRELEEEIERIKGVA